MQDPNYLNISKIRYLSVCNDTTVALPAKLNALLVEPALSSRSDTERLLNEADYCVTTVRNVREIFDLRFETPVAFAVLNDWVGSFGLKAASEAVRRQWPLAKILIIGSAVPTLEDHLYDETIGHRHEDDGFLKAVQVLTKDAWREQTTGGYVLFQREVVLPKGTEQTKASERVAPEAKKPDELRFSGRR